MSLRLIARNTGLPAPPGSEPTGSNASGRGVVVSRHPGALAAQLLHAGPDRAKIVGGTRSAHVSAVQFFSLALCSAPRQKRWVAPRTENSRSLFMSPGDFGYVVHLYAREGHHEGSHA